MRVYILALTRYGISVSFILYTLLAYILLKIKKESLKTVLEVFQTLVNAAFLILSYGTLYAADKDGRYLFLGMVQVVAFTFALLVYKTLYPEANHPLFHNVCMMLSTGLVILSRLSMEMAVRQSVMVAGGLLVFILLPLFRSRFVLLKKPKYIYAGIGIAALGIVLVAGTAANGSLLGFTIFGITFQPSEFVKILFLFFVAGCLAESESFSQIVLTTILAAAHVLILIASKDLGSAVIFFVVYILMLYIASGKTMYLIAGLLCGAAGACLCYFAFRHVRVRVQAFLDPWSVIETMGYQISQSLFAIGFGGAFGTGLTQGMPDRIPYVETDFVFSAITEEMGLIVASCLILICLNCFLIIMKLALNFADRFCQLLAFGAASCFAFQTFLTIGGETKFIPLTGVTLPLVSYGGSSVLSTIVLFTFLEILYILQEERIDAFRRRYEREQKMEQERKRRQGQKRPAARQTAAHPTAVRQASSRPTASRLAAHTESYSEPSYEDDEGGDEDDDDGLSWEPEMEDYDLQDEGDQEYIPEEEF